MAEDPIERWELDTLVQLIPRSTPTYWRRMVRVLVARRTLVKSGRGWLGRRSEIEAALLEGEPVETNPHQTTIRRHTCRHGAACETKLEVHCTCGFGQGASCYEHANVIAHDHVAEPDLPVIVCNEVVERYRSKT